MKICVVSDQAFPIWGGEGEATQNLCLKLAERGHQVLFLTSRVSHPPVVKGIEVIRFPSIFVPQKGHFVVTLSSHIVPILKKRKIQIVHVNLPTFLGWQSFRAARKLDIPCVAGFHVQVGNVVPCDGFLFSPVRRLLEMWFFHFYRTADLLMSPSYLGQKILSSYSSKEVEVISNGVNFGIFDDASISPATRRRFREKLNLTTSPLLLYVGRLSREKNLNYLLRVMQIVSEKNDTVKLLIVGRGELKAMLEKRAHLMALDKKIIFAGFLPVDDLLCAYSEADIFILPSLFELQSIAVLEAMAMGKVILVARSSQSAACELVQEGINGYTFDLGNPDDAAEKIHFILSRPSLKESLQQASFRIAREHDIEMSISRMECLYGKLSLRVQAKKQNHKEAGQ